MGVGGDAYLVVAPYLIVNLSHLVGRLHVGIVLLDVANLAHTPHGREEFIVGKEIVQVVLVAFFHRRVEGLQHVAVRHGKNGGPVLHHPPVVLHRLQLCVHLLRPHQPVGENVLHQ